MTKTEYDDILSGLSKIQIRGNIYECIGEDLNKNIILSDVNDGYAITVTPDELMAIPSEDII